MNGGFSGGSAVKNLPAMQEKRVRSLGQEDPLEKGMATHSSILVCPWGSKRVGHDWVIELNRTEMMLVLTRSVCAQSCLTLWDHMNCHPPGSSVSGILQARILEWVAIPFSRRYSWFKDRTWIFCIIGRFFIIWTTRDYKSDNFNMSAWIHLA